MTADTISSLIHEYVRHICVGEASPGDVVAYKRGVGVVFTGDTGAAWRMNVSGSPGNVFLDCFNPNGRTRVPARKIGHGQEVAMLVRDEGAEAAISEILRHGKRKDA